MATTTRYPIRIPLRLPRPIEPTESPASKPHRPQTPNLPPTLHTSAPCFRSNQRQPTRSNLHSLNSWPAVQCNEGFCNAPQGPGLDLHHNHGVAETSSFREWRQSPNCTLGTVYRCPGLGNSDIGADIAAGPSLTQPDAQPTATRSLVGAGCPNTDPVDVDLGHSSVSITRTRIWRKILEFIRLPLPLLPVARGRFFYRNIWPDFRVFRIQ